VCLCELAATNKKFIHELPGSELFALVAKVSVRFCVFVFAVTSRGLESLTSWKSLNKRFMKTWNAAILKDAACEEQKWLHVLLISKSSLSLLLAV